MPAFFGYIANITYYLLFAAVVNMVAPSGKYKKFVSLVMGFTLLVIIIAPLRNLGRDFNATDFFAGVAGMPTMQQAFAGENDARLHNTALAAAFEEQLFIQLEGLLSRNGFTLHEASFTYTEDFSRITAVWVEVSGEAETRRVPFIRIEPVQVNRGRDTTPETDPLTENVKNLIADFYNLPREHINVTIPKR
jgi:hypothetical protein